MEVGYVSSANGGSSWSTPQTVAGPMSLAQIASTPRTISKPDQPSGQMAFTESGELTVPAGVTSVTVYLWGHGGPGGGSTGEAGSAGEPGGPGYALITW
ncbi:hypothetical protein VM95_11630 [Streptomyces rubellomurinus]|uniref:Exo-alpha-sialidase n=1 Tax=Streptomyces rubellomurinus (strain ATCC 31215) TaxID=359131 RepID=A0A0F2TI94_STRR3|nr:hypothetical protein VM95_11630 [Streptomyces rubellomurinus]